MSLEAMAWVLNDAPDLPSHCFGVLMGLANHADCEGRAAFLGQGKLSGYARKTGRQVRRDLQELENLGLIRRGNQSYVAHIPADKRPIVWNLAMEQRIADKRTAGDDPDGVEPPVDNSQRPDVHVRPDVHDRPLTTGRKSPAGHERPDVDVRADADDRTSMAERPDVHVLQTVLEPKSTTTTSSSSASADDAEHDKITKPKRTSPAAKRFAEFWKLYPKKVGKDAAEKVYKKAVASGIDEQAIIDGALAYSLECRMKERGYIKNPQGWLNDGRWEDETAPAAVPPREIQTCAKHTQPQPCISCAADAKAEPDDPWTRPADPFAEPPF